MFSPSGGRLHLPRLVRPAGESLTGSLGGACIEPGPGEVMPGVGTSVGVGVSGTGTLSQTLASGDLLVMKAVPGTKIFRLGHHHCLTFTSPRCRCDEEKCSPEASVVIPSQAWSLHVDCLRDLNKGRQMQ